MKGHLLKLVECLKRRRHTLNHKINLAACGEFWIVGFADSWLSGLNEAAPTRGLCLPR